MSALPHRSRRRPRRPIAVVGTSAFTIPSAPSGVACTTSYVITRGGEYLFLPSLSALRWLADPRARANSCRGFGTPGRSSTASQALLRTPDTVPASSASRRR